MPFHPRIGSNVVVQNEFKVENPEKQNEWDTMVFCQNPLGDKLFTFVIEDTFDSKLVHVGLGVTNVNPDQLSKIPSVPLNLSHSLWMFNGDLYKADEKIGSCPDLKVSPGDTVAIKHGNRSIQFFRNNSLFFNWDIRIRAPVWAFVWMNQVNRMLLVEVKPNDNVTSFLPVKTSHETLIAQATNDSAIPRREGRNKKETYKMSSRPRGFAIIANMYSVNGCPARVGSEHDVTALEKTWEALGYKVITWIDKDSYELITDLKAIAGKEDLTQHDSFVLVIMSHGKQGHILASNGMPVDLKTIFWIFDNEKCQRLRNKPKMFFIQACRGSNEERDLTDADPEPVPDAMKLPEISDMLVMYSTAAGKVTYRDRDRGAYFIQALCYVLDEYSTEKDALRLFTQVIAKVRDRNNRITQSPIFKSTLSKELWLNPPSVCQLEIRSSFINNLYYFDEPTNACN